MTDHSKSTFFLLRHGLSEANRDEIVQGHSDYPLASEGVEQTEALIRAWKAEGRTFSQIISSPLKRAADTARLIAEAFELPLRFDEIWMERSHGEVEDTPYAYARDWYADQPHASPFEPIFETGESEWSLHIRACEAIRRILLLDPAEVLIVSHGGFLSAVLRAILGIAPSSGRTQPARVSFANTGYAVLHYDHLEARWHIQSLNSTAHLKAF